MKKKITRRSRRQISFKDNQKNQLILGLGFYVVLAIMAMTGNLTWLIVGWYAFIGVVTYGAYVKDKRAAIHSKWRTPETTLHLLSVLGGWVGAMAAQNILRHKTQKSEFRLAYYLTVLINLAGLLYIAVDGNISHF